MDYEQFFSFYYFIVSKIFQFLHVYIIMGGLCNVINKDLFLNVILAHH